MSGTDSTRPEPLLVLGVLAAYQAVFGAVTDGRNRAAALVLRDLSPENLTELHVICGDVQVMVKAEQRRRAEETEREAMPS
jgi:hypothetical protein